MARYDKDITNKKLHGLDTPIIIAGRGIHVEITPVIGDFSANECIGDIIKIGTGTLTAGDLYFLHTDNEWYATDADNVDYGGTELLGIALGTSPTTNGMLIRGMSRVASANKQGTAAVGASVYVSESHTAQFDFTAPSGTNDFVRRLGYCLETDSPTGDFLLWFDPSLEHIVM